MGYKNNLVKVWYLYFTWMGLLKAHKVGIQTGNYDWQFKVLSTFAPLFLASGKSRYVESVTRFLTQLNQDPELQAILHLACSVNVTNDKNYFAFDEAMEI
ncbi:hypothetical protein Glove_350g163 [Diversispora epigaea]|uniref:Uncharacterized protein n=1 Tax=Diversispora epigaea TaxID=1348612 RepID=A0A397HFV8_9GLOM|nr:hypothetical protein Glove_350g163 [Diversispora epigaea]